MAIRLGRELLDHFHQTLNHHIGDNMKSLSLSHQNDQQLIDEWLKTNKPTVIITPEVKASPYSGKLMPTNSRAIEYDVWGKRIYHNVDKRINFVQDESTFNYGG